MLTIGICTRERPKMLAALLESLAVSVTQAGADVKILLVENGPPTGAKEVAEQFAGRLEIAYINEPRVGLVYARNAVVEAFLASESGWIALVDDDEVVAPEWLSVFLKARDEFPDTDLLVGPTLRVFNPSASRLVRAMRQKEYRYGQKLFRSGTNNCLMSRQIFEDHSGQHFFDLTYNFSGGEDFDFFRRIKLRGFVCRYFMAARTYEHVPESRQSLRFQFSKLRHQAHCSGAVTIRLNGGLRGRLSVVQFSLRDLARTLVFAGAGTVVLVFSEARGLTLLWNATSNLAAFTGRPLALWRQLGGPYETVQGH